jgi:hypothetical protein
MCTRLDTVLETRHQPEALTLKARVVVFMAYKTYGAKTS